MERTITFKRPGAGRTVTFDTETGLGIKGFIYGTGDYLYGQAGYDYSLPLIPLMPIYEKLPWPKEFTGTVWLNYPENIPSITGLCRVHFLINNVEATGVIPYNQEAWVLYGVYEFCEALQDNRQGIRNPAYWEAVERNEAKLAQWDEMFMTNFFLAYEYKQPNIPTTLDNELLPPEKRWRWYETIDGVRTEITVTPESIYIAPKEVNDFSHPRYEQTIKATATMEPGMRLKSIFGLNR